jgi:hypothetical protein
MRRMLRAKAKPKKRKSMEMMKKMRLSLKKENY